MTDQVSWERQKGESQQAFQAFVAYRDMGSDRSAAKVGRRLGRPVGTVGRWRERHRWDERAGAWDDEQERIGRERQAESVRKVNDEQAMLGRALLVKAAEALRAGLAPRSADIPRWIAEGSELQRIALGVTEPAEPELVEETQEPEPEEDLRASTYLARALEGILTELGVADRPDTPDVVRKHLMLVADHPLTPTDVRRHLMLVVGDDGGEPSARPSGEAEA